jgi:hypothetical protein
MTMIVAKSLRVKMLNESYRPLNLFARYLLLFSLLAFGDLLSLR